MSSFEVGEIVIAKNDERITPDERHLRYNGEECQVLEVMKNHGMFNGEDFEIMPVAYKVWFEVDGQVLTAAPHELKKRFSPDWKEETKARWARLKVEDLFVINPMILDPIEEMENVE